MTGLPPLRDVIKRFGLNASKALGQNFLFDSQLLDRIAAIPGPLQGQTVYEVGPGPGGLTRALLKAGADVVAVEMDHRCIAALAELESFYPGKLRVIEGDALKMDERALAGEGAQKTLLGALAVGDHDCSRQPRFQLGPERKERWRIG